MLPPCKGYIELDLGLRNEGRELFRDPYFSPLSRIVDILYYLLSSMQLYTRATSSCAFRVRIALNLKCLTCDFIPVLTKDQSDEAFRNINPQRLVPVLVVCSHLT